MIKLGLYRHFKGMLYQVVGLAKHSETLDPLVIYQALYGDYGLWVRPAGMFLEQVMHNNQQVSRFEFLDETISRFKLIN